MCAIACTHASTCTASLMHVKNNVPLLTLIMTLIVWDIGTKKIRERTKTSYLIVDHSFLNFVNLH